MGTREKKNRRVEQLPNGDLLAVQQTESRVDILPPPDEIERYEKLYPGVTKVILDTYVKQVEHRISIERTVIEGDNKRASRGQVMAFILGFIAIGGGVILIHNGKNVEGLASIISALGIMLTAFFGGAILRRIERTAKNNNLRKA